MKENGHFGIYLDPNPKLGRKDLVKPDQKLENGKFGNLHAEKLSPSGIIFRGIYSE